MVKDQQINLRVESDKMKWLQVEAKKLDVSVSGLIIKVIDDVVSGNATRKDMKIEVLESELSDLRLKFERQFNKKLPKTHRISVAVSDEEFLKLSKISSKTKLTKSEIIGKKMREKNQIQHKKQKALN